MKLKLHEGLILLLIFGLHGGCHHKTNNFTVTGDSSTAARLYHDTLSTVLLITDEDSSMLTITGKHWPEANQKDSLLQVFLDSREVHGINVMQAADGNFTFRIPTPVLIGMHQLKVSHHQSTGAAITVQINFSIKSRGD